MNQLNFDDYISPKSTLIELRCHRHFQSIRPHIVERFWDYHRDNPHIYELFKKFAIQLKNSGRSYYGIKSITERIRWHLAVETTGDEFKINNNYTSCYARLLMATNPEFDGFFQLRSHSYI